MIKIVLVVVTLLLAGAFLNSKYSPVHPVMDKVVDRTVQLFDGARTTGVGLVSDVQSEVASHNRKN